mmetsp:Transcript_26810/g.23751  ORF Transcript_26810/g.23751 Transcript_26810/m.23751 type:complete len:264 (-) Transcript_26810:592-1383(-)
MNSQFRFNNFIIEDSWIKQHSQLEFTSHLEFSCVKSSLQGRISIPNFRENFVSNSKNNISVSNTSFIDFRVISTKINNPSLQGSRANSGDNLKSVSSTQSFNNLLLLSRLNNFCKSLKNSVTFQFWAKFLWLSLFFKFSTGKLGNHLLEVCWVLIFLAKVNNLFKIFQNLFRCGGFIWEDNTLSSLESYFSKVTTTKLKAGSSFLAGRMAQVPNHGKNIARIKLLELFGIHHGLGHSRSSQWADSIAVNVASFAFFCQSLCES